MVSGAIPPTHQPSFVVQRDRRIKIPILILLLMSALELKGKLRERLGARPMAVRPRNECFPVREDRIKEVEVGIRRRASCLCGVRTVMPLHGVKYPAANKFSLLHFRCRRRDELS